MLIRDLLNEQFGILAVAAYACFFNVAIVVVLTFLSIILRHNSTLTSVVYVIVKKELFYRDCAFLNDTPELQYYFKPSSVFYN